MKAVAHIPVVRFISISCLVDLGMFLAPKHVPLPTAAAISTLTLRHLPGTQHVVATLTCPHQALAVDNAHPDIWPAQLVGVVGGC